MRLARFTSLAAAVACASLAVPAIASAKDYCFGDVPGCPQSAYGAGQLQLALAEAESNGSADRFFLAPPAQFTAGSYSYQSAEPVEIIGAGAGKTVLTGPPGSGGSVLSLAGGAGSSVHDLTIRLPQNVAGGYRGLVTKNTAHRIEVIEEPGQVDYRTGVVLQDGGTLEDSSVTLGTAQYTTAVRFGAGRGYVRRSALRAASGVYSDFGGAVERSRLTVTDSGVGASHNTTSITGSLIHVTEAQSVGIWAGTSPTYHTTLNADGVTIVGPGLPDTDGADVFTNNASADSADLNLTNSIIRGVSIPLRADAPGAGTARLAVSYSDYDPSGNTTTGGAHGIISEANVSNVGDAGFVDAVGGDYRLRPGSPLVDAGDPVTAQGLDLDGNPLVAEGDGDGIARRDLGAFELPPAPIASGTQPGSVAIADTRAPLVSGFRAAPALFTVARAATPLAARLPRGTRFRYTLSEPARVTIRLQRAQPGRRAGGKCVAPSPRLRQAKRCTRYRTAGALSRSATSGANSIRFTGRLGRRALRPGRYRALIIATDAAGNRSAPRTARFQVALR